MRKNFFRVLWAIALVFGVVLNSHAQFSKTILFNGSIVDEEGGEDATYIIQEVDTDPSLITYTTGVGEQAVELDSASGFKLPMEVTDALMASNIWSFQMRFKITDFGAGDGNRTLVNLKRSGTSTAPYFAIRTSKSTDTEGRVVFQMDDRNTRVQLFAFYFKLDEWVNLSFTIDFANQNFTLSGGTYTVSMNYTDFDYETFKTWGDANSLQYKQFFIGYHQNLAQVQKSTDPRYYIANSANLIIDELTISNEPPATEVGVFENALQQLTSHLNGDITLPDTEISTYISDALTNYSGNYLTSKTIVDAYLQAYEAAYEPLFNHSNASASFSDKHDEFGWVQLTLYLDILDNYVTNEHLSEVGELAFETADAFPGPVAETAERLDNQIVTINGAFSLDPGYNGVINDGSYTTSARRGTGYYAAPGEIVTVQVPASLVGIGAEIVVGTFTQDVIGKIDKGIRRFPRPIKYFEIVGETMQVMNPLGGIIYIYVPNGSNFGNIDITISGAVKFAYYEQSVTNQTDLAEFEALVVSGDVLWAEVATDNFMYTAPTAFFKRDDIAETVAAWDNMWEAYQLYNGRPSMSHRPEHLVIDKMSMWNTLAGGYPMVLTWGTAPFIGDFWIDVAGCNMMNILDFDQAIKDEKATYWHEMTHHTNVPTLPTEAECIVELAYVVTNHIGLGMPLDSAMKYSERGFYTRNDAIIDWVIEPNFRNNEEMTTIQRRYQQRGYSKYVDIGAMFGWDSLGLINKKFYDDWTAMGGQVNDPDGFRITDTEWILASCEALNVNVAPLYHFWGEQPHDSILSVVNDYPRSKKIYQRLREIRDFIPTTPEGFQPYFDDHAPKGNVDPTQAYNYALANWNSIMLYDSIIAQIDSVLIWYYGGDFDQDGYLFYDDCDDMDPTIHLFDLTINIEACNSYDFNGSTLTASGEYHGTFNSVHGCDSLVTLNLTILQSSDSIIYETACGSYDFLGTLLTNSGVYQHTLSNSVGCDSLITLNLTIKGSTENVISVAACGEYDFMGSVLSTSGKYRDTLTNSVGCDSLIVLNLTISEPTETIINEIACSEYKFFGNTLTESGVYRETLINSAGCDSLVTLNLEILELKEWNIDKKVCGEYEFNGKILTKSGSYQATFQTNSGCDSLVTLNLTVHKTVEIDTTLAVCNKYILNGQVLTESGNYSAVFPRFSGCDSLVNLSLIILDPEGVECKGSVTGLDDESDLELVNIYPNPTGGPITVELGKEYVQVKLDILATSGKLLQSEEYSNTALIRTKLDLPPGTYVLRITGEGTTQITQRIIKK